MPIITESAWSIVGGTLVLPTFVLHVIISFEVGILYISDTLVFLVGF